VNRAQYGLPREAIQRDAVALCVLKLADRDIDGYVRPLMIDTGGAPASLPWAK
jgi:hypothetical protein